MNDQEKKPQETETSPKIVVPPPPPPAKEEVQKPEFTRAVIIRASQDFSHLEMIENFTYDDQEYEAQPGQIGALLRLASDDIQRKQIAGQVFAAMVNEPIEIKVPGLDKPVHIKLPNLIARLSAEAVSSNMKSEELKRIIGKNPTGSGIIAPSK